MIKLGNDYANICMLAYLCRSCFACKLAINMFKIICSLYFHSAITYTQWLTHYTTSYGQSTYTIISAYSYTSHFSVTVLSPFALVHVTARTTATPFPTQHHHHSVCTTHIMYT